ncbi:MAG: LamG-like jellyroll fold domain-containing protein, partial [Pseudomonadota bacterium]
MRTAIYRRAVDSRRALNCAVAALLIALLANGANAQDSDLIAYYTFDNGVVDVTGNVEPIDTQQNAPRAPGKYGQALQFDGTHFVEVPILLSARYQPEFTVSMWVKMAPPPIDEDALRAMSNTATVVSDVLSIHATRSAEPYFFARVPGATASNREHRTYPGQWAHVMVTRKLEDRANRDGEMEPHIVTTIYSGGIATERARQFRDQSHQPSMYLGAREPQHKFPFIGLIDDLKIYSTAMSEAQVASLSRPAAGAVAASPSPGITNPTDAANNGVDDAFGGGSNTDGSALPAPGSGATGPGS